jgi:hypothetical protein
MRDISNLLSYLSFLGTLMILYDIGMDSFCRWLVDGAAKVAAIRFIFHISSRKILYYSHGNQKSPDPAADRPLVLRPCD